METNKSVHKLKGLPPVYVINLDGEPHRWKAAEDMLKYWEVKDYTRISAYDGREDDLGDILKGRYPDAMTSGEVGCTTSHLKAMKEFLKTDAPCAIMMEDDCEISAAFHWGFIGKIFMQRYHMTMMCYSWQLSIPLQFTFRCIVDLLMTFQLLVI